MITEKISTTVHLRPRLQEMLRSLRLDVTYHRGRGDFLYYNEDDGGEIEVLDLVGGFGSLLLGHSHPALVAEARELLERGQPVHAQGSNRDYAQRLAAELSRRAGEDYAVVFGNSGAEAVEAAMKHAVLQTGGNTFIALEGAFHGKTLGALQLTHHPFYRESFGAPGIRVRHVRANDLADLERAFDEAGADAAAFIAEPIRGEGGVRPLSPGFAYRAAELCRRAAVPLIADECQTGLGRTGHFLASRSLGIDPDYIVLSKTLGGGLAKISACMIKRKMYLDRFDLRHTSTYADDDFSCAIALKTLELIDDELLHLVRDKGGTILAGLGRLANRYPTVVREVRGEGLLLGIEFQRFDDADSFLLRFLASQDDLVKLLAGYLLHAHRVRVLPMLSDPFTLRIQPSAFISKESIARLLGALENICALLRDGDVARLTGFCDRGRRLTALPAPVIPREEPKFFAYNRDRFWRREVESPSRRVAWLCHLVDADDLATLEPGLAATPVSRRESLLEDWSNSASPVVMSSVDIRSRTGETVRLYSIMLPFTSSWVKERIDRGELRLPQTLVQQGVDLARSLGCGMTALGQYTSIVTANGMRLDAGDMGLTSGNSYAVGLAVEAVRRAMRARSVDPASATLAVVGATGNIGRTCAAILAPAFRSTILIGNETPGARTRLQHLVGLFPDRVVTLETCIDAARAADVVVSAPNSVVPLLEAAHFRPRAIVCDLAVPASVHPAAFSGRGDVHFIKGGMARLPHGEDLELPGLHIPRGQAYACMAEGIVLGLENIRDTGFTGTLRVARVSKICDIAKRHGFSLAAYKTNCVYGSDRSDETRHLTAAV